MKPSTMARSLAFLVAVAQLCASGVALADPEAKAKARDHFERGVAAFNGRRFGEAAEEFQTAYQLSPAFSVLYNIGQVNVALGRAVEATDAFEQYLAQAGAAIPPARKTAVRTEIERQSALIGTIVLSVLPDGAEIRIDGKSVGKAPLGKPVRVMAGKRTIMVDLTGYTAQLRELDVAPKAEVAVDFKLDPIRSHDETPALAPPVPATLPAAPGSAAQTQRGTGSLTAPPPTAAVRGPRLDAPTGNRQRAAGYVVGGVGIAVAGAGVAFAGIGASQASDALDRLRGATTGAEWDSAKSDFDTAKSRNAFGWGAVGVGAAVTVTGLVLVATAPTSKSGAGWLVAPWKTAEGGGVMARGAW